MRNGEARKIIAPIVLPSRQCRCVPKPVRQAAAVALALRAMLYLPSCIPAKVVDITHPPRDGDLAVAGTAEPVAVFEGFGTTLSAVATGGTPPYLAFRWNQNAGPVDVALDDLTSATTHTEPIQTPGRYIFRVTVQDSTGAAASDFVNVEVDGVIEADAPRLAIVGEPAGLTAEVTAEGVDVEFFWAVTSGDATIDDPSAANPRLTATDPQTLAVLLTATVAAEDGEAMTIERRFDVVAVSDLTPRVLIETNFGDITLELDGQAAPLHTANMLQYVDEGFYDGLLFHRSACTPVAATDECLPFVIQGGGFERVGEELVPRAPTQDPVLSEADNGLSNAEVYSMSLALQGANRNSGTSQFFINLADNGFLDDEGFTVFCRVVEGTGVVDAIAALETADNPLIPGEPSLPVEDVVIERMIRVDE